MTLLPTSLVGSYAQPEWLIDRAKLAGRFPPRVRATELWRVAPEYLAQAQDDATRIAIRAQEEAGLDVITDGEIRRESYSNHFATALDGADIVQIDEPYLQARPDAAREYGLAALNAALEGVTGTTAVHLCFGYAAIIHERPEGYSFLPELAGCPVDQISIETAQSGLDLGVLSDLTGKTILLGVIDLSTPEVETPELVAERVRRAFDRMRP